VSRRVSVAAGTWPAPLLPTLATTTSGGQACREVAAFVVRAAGEAPRRLVQIGQTQSCGLYRYGRAGQRVGGDRPEQHSEPALKG
jgi:hypothetical protein